MSCGCEYGAKCTKVSVCEMEARVHDAAMQPALPNIDRMDADELRQLAHQAHMLGRYAACLSNERALRANGFDRNADKAADEALKLYNRLPDWARS
jgi:hypothetical protein